MAYVDDLVAFSRSNLYFVMNFRHQRAHRIHDETSVLSGFCNNVWCGSMSAEHNGSTNRYIVNVINKNDSKSFKTFYDNFIMNNFMVAINRRWESANHPCQSFDCHLNSCTKTSWGSKQNLSNSHIHIVAYHN